MLKYFMLVFVILSVLIFDPQLYTGGDNVTYLCLAKSLAQNNEYRDISKPTAEMHKKFPVGFPLLLSIPYRVNQNIPVPLFKLIVILFGLGSLFFFYKITELVMDNWKWVPMLMFVTSPLLLKYSHCILADIPFLFFVLGTVYFAMKQKSLAAFLMAFGSCMMKSMGLVLLVVLIIHFLYENKYRWSVLCGITVLTIFFLGNGSPYMRLMIATDPYNLSSPLMSLNDLGIRVWHNLTLYCGIFIPETLFGSMFQWLKTICGFVVVGLMGYGLIEKFNKKWANLTVIPKTEYPIRYMPSYPLRIISLVVIGFGIMILLWPQVWSSPRFLIPILPLLFLLLFVDKVKLRPIILAVVFLGVISNLWYIGGWVKQSLEQNSAYTSGNKYAGYNHEWRNYFECIERLKLEPGGKVIARKPEFVYWHSGLKSVCYLMDSDVKKIQDHLSKFDYIILDQFTWTATTGKYLIPALQYDGFSENYVVIYQTKEPVFTVLKKRE